MHGAARETPGSQQEIPLATGCQGKLEQLLARLGEWKRLGFSDCGEVFGHGDLRHFVIGIFVLPFAQLFGAGLALPAALEAHLAGALRHILEHPGSLVRPRVVLQGAEAYGLGAGHGQDLAMALEYFHTASLVFDDLPCMDNAAQRLIKAGFLKVYTLQGGVLAWKAADLPTAKGKV